MVHIEKIETAFYNVGVPTSKINAVLYSRLFQSFFENNIAYNGMTPDDFAKLFNGKYDNSAYLNAFLEKLEFWNRLLALKFLDESEIEVLIQGSWLIKLEEEKDPTCDIKLQLALLEYNHYLDHKAIMSVLSVLTDMKHSGFLNGLNQILNALSINISWSFFELIPDSIREDVISRPLIDKNILYQLRELSNKKALFKRRFDSYEWVLDQWFYFQSLFNVLFFFKGKNMFNLIDILSELSLMDHFKKELKEHYIEDKVLTEDEWGQLSEDKIEQLLKNPEFIQAEPSSKGWLFELEGKELTLLLSSGNYFSDMGPDVPKKSLFELLGATSQTRETEEPGPEREKFQLLVSNHHLISKSDITWGDWIEQPISDIEQSLVGCARYALQSSKEFTPAAISCYLRDKSHVCQSDDDQIPLKKHTYV